MDRDPDQVLVERCRNGDRAAFSALVVRYQRQVFHAAYRMLGDREDARDATQVVFMKVAERLDRYDPKYRFFSWIYRIAINESIDAIRRSGRQEGVDDAEMDEVADGDDPEQRLDEAQRAERIQQALQALRPEDRAVLTLRHFAECSYEDMGRILGLEEKTVKSRLFEARRRLGKRLQDLRILRP